MNVALLKKTNAKIGTGDKLARALGIPVVSSKTKKNRYYHLVINYGVGFDSRPVSLDYNSILNLPSSVDTAVNKLEALKAFQIDDVPTLVFTEDKKEAFKWLEDRGTIVARTLIKGSRGDGIVICGEECLDDINKIPDARLYTRFYWKDLEWRVHVINSEVVHVSQKKRLSTIECEKRGIDREAKDSNKIRNHSNGWIFSNDVIESPELHNIAINALDSLDLFFGSVDIAGKLNKKGEIRDMKVLEINTATGLESPTIFDKYVEAFKKVIREDII